MSNIQLFLSLAGFLVALAQHFDNINQRFNDLTTFINKRIDDLKAATQQAA